MKKDNYLLNNLDEPLRFLLFTIDEALVLFVPLFTGMALGYVLFGVITSIILYQGLKQCKARAIGSNLRQVAYWILPNFKFFRANIPSYIRDFRG